MIRSLTERYEAAVSALAAALLIGPLLIASAMFMAASV
jgi:hypothetical protein